MEKNTKCLPSSAELQNVSSILTGNLFGNQTWYSKKEIVTYVSLFRSFFFRYIGYVEDV